MHNTSSEGLAKWFAEVASSGKLAGLRTEQQSTITGTRGAHSATTHAACSKRCQQFVSSIFQAAQHCTIKQCLLTEQPP